MDAVIIANFFNEHAPYAIKALNADKHVISECAANITLAEGVALCRAVESTQKVYMIAENYCYTKFILEMRKIYQSGEIGRVLYAEGEYNHPMSTKEFNAIAPGRNHWRNLIPSTYYCTHATAPAYVYHRHRAGSGERPFRTGRRYAGGNRQEKPGCFSLQSY